MLLRATNLLRSAVPVGRTLLQAADALSASNHTTEETQHWVTDILAGVGAASLHCLFHQRIIIFWQTDEFENSRMTERNLGCWVMWWCVGVHDPSLDESINGWVVLEAAS